MRGAKKRQQNGLKENLIKEEISKDKSGHDFLHHNDTFIRSYFKFLTQKSISFPTSPTYVYVIINNSIFTNLLINSIFLSSIHNQFRTKNKWYEDLEYKYKEIWLLLLSFSFNDVVNRWNIIEMYIIIMQ